MTDDFRTWVRSNIRPFSRVQQYMTGWLGCASFEQIRDDLTPNLKRLLRYYRADDFDIPDLMATAFIQLWSDLTTAPQLLARANKGDALRMVLDRADRRAVRRINTHERSFEALAHHSDEADDFVIDGFQHSTDHRYAAFAEAVDLRLDLEQALRNMADVCITDFSQLVALYYITTDVRLDDAAALAGKAGTKRSWWMTNVVRPVRIQLLDELGLRESEAITWKHKFFIDGIEAPLYRLMDQHEANGNLRMVATLQSLTKSEPTRILAERLKLTHTATNYYRAQAWRELNRIYRCRINAPFFYH